MAFFVPLQHQYPPSLSTMLKCGVVLFLYMSVSYYSAPPIEVTTHIHRGASMGAE